MNASHLKGHSTLADMVNSHTSVWLDLTKKALDSGSGRDKLFTEIDLESLTSIAEQCEAARANPTLSNEELIKALVPHAEHLHAKLKLAMHDAADMGDRAYYQHELNALEDILDACAAEYLSHKAKNEAGVARSASDIGMAP